MKPVVKRFLGRCNGDVQSVNRLIVTAYLTSKGMVVDDDSMLSPYIIRSYEDQWKNVETLCHILRANYTAIDLELLIDFFEFVISPSDKVVTGAIYTPQVIRDRIVDHIFHLLDTKDVSTIRIADIACGCGGFFLTVCDKLLEFGNVDCHYIYEHILYGCDIEAYCIERCKILLALKALESGERTNDLKFHLYQGNSLVFNWRDKLTDFTGFDAVVGNPPYVTSAKIQEETRVLLTNWEVCASGKADLYIPFFQIAIELLNKTGVLGYITVSNFYRSLNGKALREYFAEHNLNLTIVDFGGEQVFKGCSTYTCLFFVDKRQEGMVRFIRTLSSNVEEVRNLRFVESIYKDLDAAKGWVIRDRRTSGLLQQITNTGRHLGDVVAISNGIATLKNDLYVLNAVEENEHEFIHEYKRNRYSIERDICRPIVKPSAMNASQSVAEQTRWIIFPYEIKGKRAICYDEKRMKEQFPHTLAYLKAVRSILDNRDKGKREYEQWFAYGRSQAINLHGFRLLMPYIADEPTFLLSDIDSLLYYNGFALISHDIQQLKRLKKILNTSIFWFYIKNISKPYVNGFYSMGKRYIRYFGIPNFSKVQLAHLDKLTRKDDIENFLYLCYFGDNANWAKSIIESDL